jgi:hypothetical protein
VFVKLYLGFAAKSLLVGLGVSQESAMERVAGIRSTVVDQ